MIVLQNRRIHHHDVSEDADGEFGGLSGADRSVGGVNATRSAIVAIRGYRHSDFRPACCIGGLLAQNALFMHFQESTSAPGPRSRQLANSVGRVVLIEIPPSSPPQQCRRYAQNRTKGHLWHRLHRCSR